jgi:hypothetical protein
MSCGRDGCVARSHSLTRLCTQRGGAAFRAYGSAKLHCGSAIFRTRDHAIRHGCNADANRRGSVSDRVPGEVSLPGGYCYMGESSVKDLPLRRL